MTMVGLSRWFRFKRSATVEDRAIPGHWGGDLVFGSHNPQIATLVERQTRYVMLVQVTGKDTETVINALIANARNCLRGSTNR
jgi:IS30 family transposase